MENMWGGGKDGNPGLLNRAVGTLNSPYQSYEGSRLQDFTPDQMAAMNSIRHTAIGGGAPDTLAGRNSAMNLARGPQGFNQNPWVEQYENVFGSDNGQSGMNPFAAGSNVSPEENQFMGENPYFNQQLDRGLGKITENYNKGTAAQTRRMANLSGAFGGSAHQAMVKDNEESLAEGLGDYTDQMLSGQYDRSANLREADIGRKLGAQQFNVGITDRNIDRYNQADQINIGNMSANVDRYNQNRGMGSQLWNSERDNPETFGIIESAKFKTQRKDVGYYDRV